MYICIYVYIYVYIYNISVCVCVFVCVCIISGRSKQTTNILPQNLFTLMKSSENLLC